MNQHDENIQLHMQVIELKKQIQLLLEENARVTNMNIELTHQVNLMKYVFVN